MNALALLFTLATASLMLCLSRKWAVLPLLMGAAYITFGQRLEIGSLSFPVIRVLIAAGFLRVMLRGERAEDGPNLVDRMMGIWAIWYVCTLFFHSPDVIVFRLGVLYDIIGAYYLLRVFIHGVDDLPAIYQSVCIVLCPVAIIMLFEKLTGNNVLGIIEFGRPDVIVTGGHFRATAAFGHPILAGTVGAVCLPMAICLWRRSRLIAFCGLLAMLAMVFASGSSGPILATLAVVAAMFLWKLRDRLRAIRWLALVAILALDLVMSDPVYFLLARIDITGGSTGYFRAQLIRSALEHLNEWWLAGTDYTRHWMPSGIQANPNHTDMTNYYLQMGVWGGLLLMLLFIAMLLVGFSRVGRALRVSEATGENGFMIWTLGCILFGHATTFFSISYFDQTFLFLCIPLACIASLRVWQTAPAAVVEESVIENEPAWSPTYAEGRRLPESSYVPSWVATGRKNHD